MSDSFPEEFKPQIRCLSGNTYEASMELPVVGHVTTTGTGWEEAKLRIWLLHEAVKSYHESTESVEDPSNWTDEEWGPLLRAVKSIWADGREKP